MLKKNYDVYKLKANLLTFYTMKTLKTAYFKNFCRVKSGFQEKYHKFVILRLLTKIKKYIMMQTSDKNFNALQMFRRCNRRIEYEYNCKQIFSSAHDLHPRRL